MKQRGEQAVLSSFVQCHDALRSFAAVLALTSSSLARRRFSSSHRVDREKHDIIDTRLRRQENVRVSLLSSSASPKCRQEAVGWSPCFIHTIPPAVTVPTMISRPDRINASRTFEYGRTSFASFLPKLPIPSSSSCLSRGIS